MEREDIYAVIDLKSFYASCECAARGLDLFNTPLVVCDPTRTENTVVMSATPYLKANYRVPNVCRMKDLPKLPGMIYATPRMAYYIETSAKVVSIFLDFVGEEDLHVYSIDESFLHLSPYLSLYDCTAEELVKRIQSRIKTELGLVATAGMGPNMFLAKVCLDNEGKKRPPYIAYWGYEDVPTKLWSISPITNIWGISSGIGGHLERLGIRSLRALAKADLRILEQEFGVMGDQLHDLANGIDRTDIRVKYVPKETNLSLGQTLWEDHDLEGTELLLREMTDDLCFRMRSAHQKAQGVSLFVGYSGQSGGGGFSRQTALNFLTDDNDILYDAIRSLFHRFAENRPIRNLGIGFSKLGRSSADQVSLFDDPGDQKSRHDLFQAIDAIQNMFGRNSCLRASSLKKESTIRVRHTQIGGHKA